MIRLTGGDVPNPSSGPRRRKADPTRRRLESIAVSRMRNHAGLVNLADRAYFVSDPLNIDDGPRWLSWADVARHVLEYLDGTEES